MADEGKSTKKTHHRLRILVCDDDFQMGHRWEQMLKDRSQDKFDCDVRQWSSIDLADDDNWDIFLVDVDFANGERSVAAGSKLPRQFAWTKGKKALVILYSKRLPETRSLARCRAFTDIWCTGPDPNENYRSVVGTIVQDAQREHGKQTVELRAAAKDLLSNAQTQSAGKALEALCMKFLSHVDGFHIATNKHYRSKFELDIIVENQNQRDTWISNLGALILVECKASRNTRVISSLYEVLGKLSATRARTALVFFSFEVPRNATDAVAMIAKAASADGKNLIVLDSAALREVAEGRRPETVLKSCYFATLAFAAGKVGDDTSKP